MILPIANELRSILEFWSDVNVFPYNVSTLDGGITYKIGTIKFIYDETNDMIMVRGLKYQDFEWHGKLEELLKEYNIWL